jgi:Na+/H+ antiporter NhaA
MSYGRFHWRMFNVLARILGIGFLMAGCIGLLGFAFSESQTGGDSLIVILASVFAAVVGVLMIRVKPFRPDLDGYASAVGQPRSRARTWWTGEPK